MFKDRKEELRRLEEELLLEAEIEQQEALLQQELEESAMSELDFSSGSSEAVTLSRQLSAKLLEAVRFSAIRGNASEIRALAGQGSLGSGVDVAAWDTITTENLPQSVELIGSLAKRTGAVIAVSGAMDVVSDGTKTILLHNGCATMARITGSGCMLTTLIGAFCAAVPEHPFEATCAAMAAMGVCGELAEEKRIKNETGNATFRTDLIDAVFNLTGQELKERIRYEVYKG